jgi:hypothetical protein
MNDLASRLANRVQLTSDGHKAYLEAVEGAFGADVDFAQLVKLKTCYGAPYRNTFSDIPGICCCMLLTYINNAEHFRDRKLFPGARMMQNLHESFCVCRV